MRVSDVSDIHGAGGAVNDDGDARTSAVVNLSVGAPPDQHLIGRGVGLRESVREKSLIIGFSLLCCGESVKFGKRGTFEEDGENVHVDPLRGVLLHCTVEDAKECVFTVEELWMVRKAIFLVGAFADLCVAHDVPAIEVCGQHRRGVATALIDLAIGHLSYITRKSK